VEVLEFFEGGEAHVVAGVLEIDEGDGFAEGALGFGVGLEFLAGEEGGEFFDVLRGAEVWMAAMRFLRLGAERSRRSRTAFIARRSELLCSTAVRSLATRRRGWPAGVRSGFPVSTRVASWAEDWASFSPVS
jgi:hypothetical protein